MAYTTLVPLALFGWISLGPFFFAVLSGRRALLATVLLGWMFLPVASYPISGLPDVTKASVIPMAAFLGTLLFHGGRLRSFRLGLLDLPILIYCVSPLFTSLANGLGLYDGLSAVFFQSITVGLLYLLGRIWITDLRALKEMLIWLFAAGAAYAPLILFESRMSPQLHHWVYGYHPQSFAMAWRFGGFRPWVFMVNGLVLSIFVVSSVLAGWAVWRGGLRRRILGVKVSLLLVAMLFTALVCRSLGATVLMGVAIVALEITRRRRVLAPLLILLAIPLLYAGARTIVRWDSGRVIEAARLISEDRADSLQFRVDHEMALTAKALERPLLGWGGWGRARIRDAEGRDVSITDARWVIILGAQGLVGLLAWFSAFILPAVSLLVHMRARTGSRVVWTMICGAVSIIALHLLDFCFNGTISVVFLLVSGAVLGVASRVRSIKRVRPRPAEIPGRVVLATR